MCEMQIYWVGLRADQTLKKKRLMNLKTQQQKLPRKKKNQRAYKNQLS